MAAVARGLGFDLRLATIMNDRSLPLRNALSDAVMAGLAFVKLRTPLRDS